MSRPTWDEMVAKRDALEAKEATRCAYCEELPEDCICGDLCVVCGEVLDMCACWDDLNGDVAKMLGLDIEDEKVEENVREAVLLVADRVRKLMAVRAPGTGSVNELSIDNSPPGTGTEEADREG